VWNGSNPHHEALQGKLMSRSESEPGSASLEKMRVANLPNRLKPATNGEEADGATIGLSGVLGGGA
jgi:hypothetical protein